MRIDAILYGELNLSSRQVSNMDMREIMGRVKGWQDLQNIKWGNPNNNSDSPNYIDDIEYTDF